VRPYGGPFSADRCVGPLARSEGYELRGSSLRIDQTLGHEISRKL